MNFQIRSSQLTQHIFLTIYKLHRITVIHRNYYKTISYTDYYKQTHAKHKNTKNCNILKNKEH